jgi:Cu(I)/Ag(I) efflux system membrane protein CusA/SilA
VGDIWEEISAAGSLPGLTGAPVLMPIQTRIVMLQTGMRAAMGIKVRGPDLERIEAGGLALEAALREAPSVRAETVFAERVVGKPYLEIEIDREAIGRFGLSVAQVQEVIQLGLGGAALTRTIEGRERYAVRVRFQREERDSVEALRRLPVDAPGGVVVVTLEQLAQIRYVRGPQMIKSEDTFPVGFVTFDRRPELSEAEAVEQAARFLEERLRRGALSLPEGVSYRFAGTYENQARSDARLRVLVPVALALIFVLLYVQFRRAGVTLMVFSGVAVAMSGGFVLLWLYGQPWFLDVELWGVSGRELFQVGPTRLSVAVWVGFLALFGIATDDGVVMATRLEQSFQGQTPRDAREVRALVVEAGLRRVRPCLMTTATTVLALLPVLTSEGRGADVMLPMALPSLGGMSVELLTIFVVPVLYSAVEEARCWWRGRRAVSVSE